MSRDDSYMYLGTMTETIILIILLERMLAFVFLYSSAPCSLRRLKVPYNVGDEVLIDQRYPVQHLLS